MIPFTPNTTCDIFRAGNAPPATPDVAAVPGLLTPVFEQGREAGETEANVLRFTHILRVPLATDVRDDLDELTGNMNRDTVYIPDATGTPYFVTCVERIARGLPLDHKRVYLDRRQPDWASFLPVQTSCGTLVLPRTLYLTVLPQSGTCACAAAAPSIPLTYVDATGKWQGAGSLGTCLGAGGIPVTISAVFTVSSESFLLPTCFELAVTIDCGAGHTYGLTDDARTASDAPFVALFPSSGTWNVDMHLCGCPNLGGPNNAFLFTVSQ